MFNRIIFKYIENITADDIKKFSLKENVQLSDSEINIILYYIKNYYNDLLYGDYNSIFEKIKSRINPTSYKKIFDIYLSYKSKYSKYL